jgi:integrase/recombinase XerC
MNQLVPIPATWPALKAPRGIVVSAVIAAAGENAARRFLEFFAATIRNKNTRIAYYRAVTEFFAWVERHKIGQVVDIEPLHVAAYVEALGTRMAKPTVNTSPPSACASTGPSPAGCSQ